MPPKILIVDDEPDLEAMIRQKYRKQIRENELAFDFALNGKEGLEKLMADPAIDLVFTDINMPIMDGLTFLAKLKENNLTRTKAVVVSAYGDMAKIRTAMNSGAFDFITKPIDFDDMDITMQKALGEAEVHKQNEQLQTRITEAEMEKEHAIQSEKFKQQFLANMSHEIRTPMNAILGMARLTLNTPLDGTQEKYLKGIFQSGENLLVIINDILDFSKIEAGKLEFEAIDFSMATSLQTAYDTLRFKAEEKGLDLKIDIDPRIAPFIVGDPVRLNQVILNLAGNSVKFTEKGGVTLRASLIPQSDAKVQRIKIEVIDTGIGIHEDKLGKVFESFSQASSDTNRKFGGTGLGLTISKELVERQKGTIGVASQLGVGTTFWFEIPYPVGDGTGVGQKEKKENVVLENLRILLVEDNAFNQMVATDTLEELIKGVTIDLAENGQEALDKVRGTPVQDGMKHPYHIVLMDIQMPVMDGFEATRTIRKLPEPLNKIPIIALTANAIKEEVEKCHECGMDGFVTKPFDPQVLLAKIAELI